ncbi:MAG TPA: hypothetical protein VFV94_15290, partial [Polyangiaceae bacterium]|nr:hypothetical protein [Polyangiaceae bacterium]
MRFPKLPPKLEIEKLKVGKIMNHISPTLPDGRYLHWHDLRWRPPPEGLTREEWWFAKKIGRVSARVAIPQFLDEGGVPFSFCRLDVIDRA